VLVVAPSLQAGAAAGAVELTRILAAGGHKPSGGRLLQDVTAAGARFIAMNVASQNSVAMLRNAMAMVRLVRAHRCDVIHAHGRAPGWSAYFAAQRPAWHSSPPGTRASVSRTGSSASTTVWWRAATT